LDTSNILHTWIIPTYIGIIEDTSEEDTSEEDTSEEDTSEE
jgi:hypothetical protein